MAVAKYLCDLSEVFGIGTNVLKLLVLFNDKLKKSQINSHSPFIYVENNIKEVKKTYQYFSNYKKGEEQNLQENYSFWEDKIFQIALKCKEYNCDTSIINELTQHADKLDQAINIGFFGVTSSGKTALMNALIGESLLPEKTVPTTNVAVKVSQASKRRAIVNFDDGNQEIWSGESLLTQLHEATSEELNSKNFKNINEIKLEHPDFIFPPYFEVFDTPGINAMGHDDHKKITTEKVLPQVDIVIYLTTCTNQIKQADRDFINLAKKHISSDQKIIFVITGKGKIKTDKDGKTREAKWQLFISALRKCLDNEGIGEDIFSIVLIDSIWGQMGRLGHIEKWEQSGISNLIENLSFCYSTLQQNWLNLNLRQVIDLLENKIQSPLKSKLQDDKTTLKQNKVDNDNQIKILIKFKLTNSVDIKRFVSDSQRKKSQLSLPDKPVSNLGFERAIKEIDNTSSDIMRKIQNEFYNCQREFIKQFKELGIKELSRREINFNRQSVKSPSAKTKQVERDSTGFLSSLARFFHVGGKEKIDIFDSDKSYLSLKKYYNNIKNAIELIINDCSAILESQFHSVLIKEIKMLEAKHKDLDKVSLDTDRSYLAYLDTTIEDLNYQVDFLKNAQSIQKSKKKAKHEHFSNRKNRFDEGFANINHLPALWNKYDDLSSKHGIIFVGGDREKHITWFNELYQIQIPEEGDRDIPLWFGKASQDFTNYYPHIPYPDETSSLQYFLSIPESINGTDNFFPYIVDHVLQKTDWVLGIYIDVNRIGSGLSDIKQILGTQFEALASVNKVFFWNMDMGYFECTERLYELITDINDIFDKPPCQNIPRFFGQSGDMRWTYLMDIALNWNENPEKQKVISSKWQEKELEYDKPFIPSVLLELDNKYFKVLNPFLCLLDNAEKGCKDAQFQVACAFDNGDGVPEDKQQAFKWYLESAQNGHSDAQFIIGNAYHWGNDFGFVKDDFNSFEWFLKAAKQGNEKAQFNVGNAYYSGSGVLKDKHEAFNWYIKSAIQGNVKAQNAVGKCYRYGYGTCKDNEEAFKWFLKAATKGNAKAQNAVAQCYNSGDGICKDKEEAFEWFLKSAIQGNSIAQFNVGICYDCGNGIYQCKEKAFEWYMKAAQQDHADAQWKVGFCYRNGDGVSEDKKKAFEWFMKAGKQGDAHSQYCVGLCYDVGDGVSEDKKKAFEWYMKAAEQDHARAQQQVGFMYDYGDGVSEDKKKAFEWYMKAAEQGYDHAQFCIGNQYYYGEGVAENDKMAFEWYMKAAQQGHARARRIIGHCYEYGIGVTENNITARHWYQKAIQKGTEVYNGFNWGVEWGFFDDDIWITNTSNKYWDAGKYFLKVTISKRSTGEIEYYSLLQVPALRPGEKHTFTDIMSISSGSDKNHAKSGKLYEI